MTGARGGDNNPTANLRYFQNAYWGIFRPYMVTLAPYDALFCRSTLVILIAAKSPVSALDISKRIDRYSPGRVLSRLAARRRCIARLMKPVVLPL